MDPEPPVCWPSIQPLSSLGALEHYLKRYLEPFIFILAVLTCVLCTHLQLRGDQISVCSCYLLSGQWSHPCLLRFQHSFLLPLLSARGADTHHHAWFMHSWGWTQGFLHALQALYQLSHISSLVNAGMAKGICNTFPSVKLVEHWQGFVFSYCWHIRVLPQAMVQE